MSGDPMEAAAFAALAGERAGRGKGGDAKRGVVCANCGEPVTRDYCGACGQKDVDVRRPLIALVRESLGDLLALDSRLVRTLGRLVLQPGRVSRDYVEGRRQSYVPPLRLYLFAIIALIAASWLGDAVNPDKPAVCVGLCLESDDLEDARARLVAQRDAAETPEEAAVLSQALALLGEVRPAYDGQVGVQIEAEESVADLERRLRATGGSDVAVSTIIDAVRKARAVDLDLDGEPAPADDAPRENGAAAEGTTREDAAAEAAPTRAIGEDVAENWGVVVRRVMDNHALFQERMKLWLPRIFVAMAFVFALMTPALYWRRYMAEHVVFSLYLHSGITAVMAAATLIDAVPHASLAWLFAGLYVPYFIGASLRRFFGGRRWTTILRMIVALMFYAVGLGALFVFAGMREAVRLAGVPWGALWPFGPAA